MQHGPSPSRRRKSGWWLQVDRTANIKSFFQNGTCVCVWGGGGGIYGACRCDQQLQQQDHTDRHLVMRDFLPPLGVYSALS